MKRFLRSSWLILIVVGLLSGFLWQRYSSSGPAGGPKRMGQVKRGDLIQRVTVAGQIEPARRTVFVAPFAGYVHRLYVSVGQKVKKGEPVVSVTSSLQSPEPVYPIRAPFTGTVVDVGKTEGEYVNERDMKAPIVRVDDLDRFYVVAKAPEVDAARIKLDMEVEIRVNALSTEGALKGIVRSVDLAAEEADGWKSQQSTFQVVVEVLKPPASLRSGQSAIIDIVTERISDVLYLEHEFINQDGDQFYVMDKRGKRKNIQVGKQSDLAVEIKSGLREGEEVEQVDFLKLLERGA